MQKPEKKYQPLRGKIIHGDALGRTLGFPTANLQTTDLLPDNGVYIAKLEWNTKLYQGILNIGFRPTVQGCEQRVEMHLFNFNGSLYGESVTVTPLLFLRKERKFETLEALRAQIAQDQAAARDYLQGICTIQDNPCTNS
ncbi:MAG: riboflavin kinase [Bacteroidales bacterium]|nr:riboflavin kinase [Bacteroidales bacterium]